MAVILYREGNETKVNGVMCRVGRFDPFQFHDAINDGWVVDPKELYKPEEKEEVEPAEEKKEELSTANIRLAAKEAGIEGWENGRISRLKRELGYGG